MNEIVKNSLYLFLIIMIIGNVSICGCISGKYANNLANPEDLLDTNNIDLGSINTSELIENLSHFKNETGKSIYEQFLKYEKENPFKINESHIIIADEIAAIICGIGEIDEAFFTDYDYFAEKVYKFDHVIKAINENFNTKYQNILASREMHTRLAYLRKTSSYVPVIDSYNQLYNASLKLHSEKNEDYYIFYKNLFIFGADVVFTKEKMAYSGAFKATGSLARYVGLSQCTKVIGYQGYGLVLHSIHWIIRDEINETINDIFALLRDEDIIPNIIGAGEEN